MTTLARRFGAAALLGLCAGAGGAGACNRPPELPAPSQGAAGQEGGASGSGGSGIVPEDDGGPPDLDAGGLCGNQLHQIITDAPNVYFVIDSSGSMAASFGGGSRAVVVRKAAVELVRKLGALINVGAALFPVGADADQCATGQEVMAVSPGDPYSGTNQDGPTTSEFKHRIAAAPLGGTPLAATLNALRPKLQALPGKTIVLLVTDGGPNCNAGVMCEAGECGTNIDGCTGDECCNAGGNCCTPSGPAGPEACIDRKAAVDAVKAYAQSGLPVYVVGIPGSEHYSDVLVEMALSAGTAQLGKPFYYAVDAVDNLSSVLGDIAAVAVSCLFTLEDPPEEGGQTNVYLDGVVVPADLENGWRFMDPELTRIELLGDACDKLKSGKVKAVQIVSGCPTEPAK